jgi:antitoxin component of MazEF toxin-antitoxin module
MKKLVKHGNSYALIIDKPLLDLLQIGPDTPLEIWSDGQRLVIQPLRDQVQSELLEEALEWLHANYANCMKRLADS